MGPTQSTKDSHSSKLQIPDNSTIEYLHLDISYICPNMIAMSYPSNKAECEKNPNRNKIEEVKQYLEKKHKGHYYVINLCLEESQRSYSSEIFEDRVWFFGITDQSPPPFELLLEICEKIKSWLDQSEKNVIVIHCKEGIGRTGTIASCFLLYEGMVSTAQKALQLFTSKREIQINLIIRSQKRWIGYFESYLRNDRHYDPAPILIHSIRLGTGKGFKNHLEFDVDFGWMDGPSPIQVYCNEEKRNNQEIVLVLKNPKKVNRDFELSVYGVDRRTEVETKTTLWAHLFRFWINTAFLNDAVPVGNKEQHFQFTLRKKELDIFTFRKNSLELPSDLMVTVYYTRSQAQEQGCANQEKLQEVSEDD